LTLSGARRYTAVAVDQWSVFSRFQVYTKHEQLAAGLAALLVGGCAATPIIKNDEQRRALSLLMPQRIEIVEPFTRVKSFDNDRKPDGIELLLRAVNALDNPGLMIVGDVRFELYEFVPASGDNRGKRLDTWDISLNTRNDQKDYWNQVTQMYEFRLWVDPAVLPNENRYMMVVTYQSPLGDRLSADCLIEYREPGMPMGSR